MVDDEAYLRIRSVREDAELRAAVASDLVAAVDPELRRVGDEVERRGGIDRHAARSPEAQRQLVGEVLCGQRNAEAVAARRGRDRAGDARVRLPLENRATQAPRGGVRRRGRHEELLPHARAAYRERPLPDKVRRVRRPVGGKGVEKLPGEDHIRRLNLVRRVDSAEDLPVKSEARPVPVLRRVEHVCAAEPVVLVGVGNPVPVEVDEGSLHGGIGIGAVHKAVAVGVA